MKPGLEIQHKVYLLCLCIHNSRQAARVPCSTLHSVNRPSDKLDYYVRDELTDDRPCGTVQF